MSRLAHALCLGMLVAAASWQTLAQDAVGAAQGTKIHMHGSDTGYAADGYLFQPQGPGPFAEVLLIPDSQGISDFTRMQAQDLAASGTIAVVIDLSRGQGPATGAISEVNVRADLSSALTFLRSLPNVRTGALGVAGWGVGADYALQLASSNTGIRAVVLVSPDKPRPEDFAGLHAALLGNFPGPTDRHLQTVAKRMQSQGCPVDFYFYPDAHSRFYDPKDTAQFRVDDAALASKRIQDFFAKSLAR